MDRYGEHNLYDPRGNLYVRQTTTTISRAPNNQGNAVSPRPQINIQNNYYGTAPNAAVQHMPERGYERAQVGVYAVNGNGMALSAPQRSSYEMSYYSSSERVRDCDGRHPVSMNCPTCMDGNSSSRKVSVVVERHRHN